MKKIILDYCYKFTFLSLYFATLHPSETRVSKKQDWITFKNLVASGPNKDFDIENRRKEQITQIFNRHPDFIHNNINAKDLITIAIQNHDDHSFDIFLKSKIKIKRDRNNLSLPFIFTAAHYGNLYALKKLQQKNPHSVLITEENSQTSILHQVLIANPDILKLYETNGTKRQREILTTLLKTKGIEKTLSIQDKTGKTPLHLMVSLGCDEEIKTVLTEYKDLIQENKNLLTIQDNDGLTPIDYAFFSNNKEILKSLLKTKDIEKTLIKNALSLQDKTGKTPLHLMVSLGFNEEFKTVLTEYKDLIQENKNLLKIQDNDGLTPLDYAFFSNNIDLLNFINQSNIENIFSDQQKICLDILQDKFVPNASWSLNPTDLDYLSKLLIETSRKGVYLPLVDALLSKGADINYYDARLVKEGTYNNFANNSFIGLALRSNDLNLLKKLKNKGLNLKQSDYEDNTVLHHYIESVYDIKTEILEFLILNEVNVNAKNKYGQTPFHRAVLKQREKAITILIKNNADINSKDNDGLTPLHVSISSSSNSINTFLLEVLINNNADINAQNNQGDTPLHSILRSSYINQDTAIDFLLKKSANVQLKNLENKTALHIAIEKSKFRFIEPLIKYYTDDQLADISKDFSDKTLNNLIFYYNDLNFLKKLKNMGLILKQSDFQNNTLLHQYLDNVYNKKTEILEFLISNVVNVNAKNKSGHTLLHEIIFKQRIEAITILIKNNADINSKDNEGYTPLHISIISSFISIDTSLLEVLINNNADINAQNNKGNTPLHLILGSSYVNKYTATDFLLNKGANAQLKNLENKTALHIAIEKLELRSIELLIKHYTDDQLADVFKDFSDKKLNKLISYCNGYCQDVCQKINQYLKSKEKSTLCCCKI